MDKTKKVQTPEERRETFIVRHMPDTWSSAEKDPARLRLGYAYDDFLVYFDQHEPAVADAIRYGLREAGQYVSETKHIGNGIMENKFGMKYTINYPEGHNA